MAAWYSGTGAKSKLNISMDCRIKSGKDEAGARARAKRVTVSSRSASAGKINPAGADERIRCLHERTAYADLQASALRRRRAIDQSVHRVHDRRPIRADQH